MLGGYRYSTGISIAVVTASEPAEHADPSLRRPQRNLIGLRPGLLDDFAGEGEAGFSWALLHYHLSNSMFPLW